ncbi:MAG: nucleotidyltransferase family protein, partial [Prevotella sp.]|nr:nucleotidyltransferase family protein [Prevotella sp.]
GVEKLSDSEQYPPRKLLLSWIRVSVKIKQRNELIDSRSREMLEMLSETNIHACLLKGQGMACYYPLDVRKLRQPGDIDVYADCSRERIDSFAQTHGTNKISWNYRHIHLHIWKDTLVELHYRIEYFYNPFKNLKFQQFLRNNKEHLFYAESAFVAPSLTMNLFYALLHIYNHVLSSRIGLKQVIDYYFLLMNANGEFGCFNNGETVLNVLRQFGLERFTGGMMWLLHEVTGIERKYMLCDPIEDDGKFILRKIIMPDNDDKGISQNYAVKDHDVMSFIIKRSFILSRKYPSDSLWTPIWYVWHRCWKVVKRWEKVLQ